MNASNEEIQQSLPQTASMLDSPRNPAVVGKVYDSTHESSAVKVRGGFLSTGRRSRTNSAASIDGSAKAGPLHKPSSAGLGLPSAQQPGNLVSSASQLHSLSVVDAAVSNFRAQQALTDDRDGEAEDSSGESDDEVVGEDDDEVEDDFDGNQVRGRLPLGMGGLSPHGLAGIGAGTIKSEEGEEIEDDDEDEDEDTFDAPDDPAAIYEYMLASGVPESSMKDVYKALGCWHCQCCTQLNQKHDNVCTSCGTQRESMGLRAPRPPPPTSHRTLLGYDERMMGHRELNPRNIFEVHPERPARIAAIFKQLSDAGLAERCCPCHGTEISRQDLLSCHTEAHLEFLDLVWQQEHYHINGDTYACRDSRLASDLSCGITVGLVERVMRGEARNAFAVVRPPGHHAEADQAMGFCMYNNVAVAAKIARRRLGAERVLILDWDVHHGNGTEHIFEDDPSVLYCSLHRFDRGEFYPGTGSPYSVGKGEGAGFNVNVAWPHGGMGDPEYIAAFCHLLMPIFTQYNPDLVLVSAGFDSAEGDPLGGCKVSPAGYAFMTSQLQCLAGGKMVVILEGGYNLRSISVSAEAVLRILLGEPMPPLKAAPPSHSALNTISLSQRLLAPYWDCLKVHPSRPFSYTTPGSLGSASSTAPNSPSYPPGVKPSPANSGESTGPGSSPAGPPRPRRVQIELRADAAVQCDPESANELPSRGVFSGKPSTPATRREKARKSNSRLRRGKLWSGRKQFLVWRWWIGRKRSRREMSESSFASEKGDRVVTEAEGAVRAQDLETTPRPKRIQEKNKNKGVVETDVSDGGSGKDANIPGSRSDRETERKSAPRTEELKNSTTGQSANKQPAKREYSLKTDPVSYSPPRRLTRNRARELGVSSLRELHGEHDPTRVMRGEQPQQPMRLTRSASIRAGEAVPLIVLPNTRKRRRQEPTRSPAVIASPREQTVPMTTRHKKPEEAKSATEPLLPVMTVRTRSQSILTEPSKQGKQTLLRKSLLRLPKRRKRSLKGGGMLAEKHIQGREKPRKRVLGVREEKKKRLDGKKDRPFAANNVGNAERATRAVPKSGLSTSTNAAHSAVPAAPRQSTSLPITLSHQLGDSALSPSSPSRTMTDYSLLSSTPPKKIKPGEALRLTPSREGGGPARRSVTPPLPSLPPTSKHKRIVKLAPGDLETPDKSKGQRGPDPHGPPDQEKEAKGFDHAISQMAMDDITPRNSLSLEPPPTPPLLHASMDNPTSRPELSGGTTPFAFSGEARNFFGTQDGLADHQQMQLSPLAQLAANWIMGDGSTTSPRYDPLSSFAP